MSHAPSSRATVLDPELAAFLQSGVSMHAASCDASRVANLSRPLGCRVSPDRTRVTVFLLASHSGGMLADMRANGRIAVVFSLPRTHRTIQLKGSDAAVEPLQDGDHILVARHREDFVKELTHLGYEPSLPALLLAGARGDLIAVTFTVEAVFVQTPGPTAGTPLKP
jgi:hypothetical protein